MKSLIHRLLSLFFVLLLVETGSAAESADELIDKGKVFERKFQANEALPLYLSRKSWSRRIRRSLSGSRDSIVT